MTNNSRNNFVNETMSRKLIYIYEKKYEEEKGFLKIGDASVDSPSEDMRDNSDYLIKQARKRIRSFDRTSPINILYATMAVNNEFAYFRDYQVHDVLVRSGYPKLVKGDSHEWFEILPEVGIDAINAVKKGESYIVSKGIERNSIIFRPEQENAINQAINAFKCHNEVLWNAKMRFGKTLSSLEVIKRLNFKRTIIITHRPIVNNGWFEDFNKIFDSKADNIEYFSKKLGSKKSVLDNTTKKSIVYFASIQDLRESSYIGGDFKKNEEIFEVEWDLIIMDEAHEGTKTELAQTLLENLRSDTTKVLKLSGTPFNLLEDFDEDQIYTWDYIMEQEAKESWDFKRNGDSNPYSVLPKLHMFVYEMGDIFKESIFVDEVSRSFNFSEFFRVQDDKFVHEVKVLEFLNIISAEDNDLSNVTHMPFGRDIFRDQLRHTLWTLPSRKAGQVLERMLKNHSVFKKYNIANLVEDTIESTKDLDKIKKAITSTPEDSHSITLTVRKGTVGITVDEWTGILVLNNTESASNYLQAIFRVQSPYLSKLGQKEKAYVFDFAPDRTLKMVSEAVNLNTRGGSINTSSQEDKMRELLNFLPIIGMKGNKLVPYSIESMLIQLKRAQAEKAVLNGFDDFSIYNDELLKLNSIDLENFSKLLKKIGTTKQSVKPNSIKLSESGLTDEEWSASEKGKKKPPRHRTPEEIEAMKKRREQVELKKSLISILRGISIRIPLMIYGMDLDIDKDVTLNNFSVLIDDSSWSEFMPKGITKDDFKEFKKYYDSEIFVEAGRRIRRTALAADKLSPDERIEKITSLFSGFKNPDKETVLTPWRVINMHMGHTFGGYNFYDKEFPFYPNNNQIIRKISNGINTEKVFSPNIKVLEVNSKTGLYPLYMAYSIYKERFNKENLYWLNSDWIENDKKLWNSVLENNIFVINKTPMSKTITYRTLLGYNYTSGFEKNLIVIEDLVNKLRSNMKGTILEIREKFGGKDMKFDVVVGNPPYMEKRGNYNLQIHFEFLQMSYLITEQFVSLIQPLNWLNNEPTLSLVKNNLQELHRFSDSTKVFTEVSIPSGVGYSLINKNESFDKTTVYENNYSKKINITGNFNIDDIRIKEEVKFTNSIHTRISEYIGHKNSDKSLQSDPKGEIEIWFKETSGKSGRNEWKKVRRKDLPDGDIIDQYKVMISKDGHAEKSDTKPENIFNNKAEVLNPGQISTDRPYLLKSESKKEAILIAEYANSKFFRRLLHIQNKASSVSKSAFEDVPDIVEWIADYDKSSWDSLDLFLNSHYELSEETINDIDRRIAPK